MDETQLDQYIQKNVKTFDLIGFRGKDGVSKLIIHLERKAIKNKDIHISTKISHIGLAIKGKHLYKYRQYIEQKLVDAIDPNAVYIFESTASGRIIDKIPDVCGEYFFGAQLRDLKEVVKNYNGKVFHSSRLFKVNKSQISKLVEFINHFNHRPYEKSLKSLFGTIYRFSKETEITESVFCSELVTRALQYCDILENFINPEHVVPLDFYQDPTNSQTTLDVDREIPLIYDYAFLFYFKKIKCTTLTCKIQIRLH